MPTTHLGYFLIADITGYTGYLSQSELEHAQQTLSALLNLLIEHTQPPLVISRLAGDAVISYALRDNFYQGQTFVEIIEDTYVAFRRAIDLMVLNTSCSCNACKNIKNLDLKFFIHFGAFGIQKLGEHEEIVGTDVNTIHRLMKNRVTEKTGIRAYALYTDAAIGQLGLSEASETMIYHEETYEHLGSVRVWVKDMHPVWKAKREQLRLQLPPEQVLMQVATLVPMPPERIWDYLIQAEHYNVFAGGTSTEITRRQDGLITAGSEYLCYHGDSYVAQTVLEWQPFERILVKALAPIPVKRTYLLVELRLEPAPEGTRFVQVFARAEGPALGRFLANLVFRSMRKTAQRDIDNFGMHIEADFARMLPTSETAGLPELSGAPDKM